MRPPAAAAPTQADSRPPSRQPDEAAAAGSTIWIAAPRAAATYRRDLEHIRYLQQTGEISADAASVLIGRARRKYRAAFVPRVTAPPDPKEVLLERIRRLSPDQLRDALIFLSGARPADVERAIASVFTPLSTMGTAR